MEVIFHEQSVFLVILLAILCSELIHHFCEIFNVKLGVPNLVTDGEI